MEATNGFVVTRRRSSRAVFRIPLLVNVTDSPTETEWEQVETVILSRHGGLIRTQQVFPAGSILDIRMRDKGRSARARVVWTSPRTDLQRMDVGFEILDYPDFWDFNFPPDHFGPS